MNENDSKKPCCQKVIPFLAVLGAFLIVGWLVGQMVKHTQPAPVDQTRGEERRKALKELRAAEAAALSSYAWQDQGKGIVRLPVNHAMEMVAAKDAKAVRAEMLTRLEKATAAPPKAPEKPSEFE